MKRLLFILLLLAIKISGYSQTISIFGGEDHSEFLGILNAPPSNSKSIWNEYCNYGNSYNSKCIWNEYGSYGNEYSQYSPWNEYSSDVPILVDEEGNYYGKFNSSNKNEVIKIICKLAPSIISDKLDLVDAYEMLFE